MSPVFAWADLDGAALTAAIVVWLSVPVWLPALRAWLPRYRLPRAALFTVTVAAVVYGAFTAVVLLLLLPIDTAATFFAPPLQELGLPAGGWMAQLHDRVVVPVYAFFVPALPSLAWIIMLLLGRRWPHIVAALASAPASPSAASADH